MNFACPVGLSFGELSTVVTQPDQPVGRKKIITPPPVKILAEKNNLPVLQPGKLDDDFNQKILAGKPDIFIVAEYGNILPQTTLDIPQHGALNIHPSLLPKYRGPSPIQTALLNGDQKTGLTIIKMDAQMDHGSIISKIQLLISKQDTYTTLSKKLAQAGAELLLKTIPQYISGKITPEEQNHRQATLTKIIKKEDGLITQEKTAQDIYNTYRAYIEWPGIYYESRIKNQESRLKLINIELTDLENKKNNPLELFVENKNLYLTCADNTVLKINSLQPQGKKQMNAISYINGYLKNT